MSTQQRLRIRYAKRGELRLVSHRDMVRAFERLFRRAAVPLAMTAGFHPRPRLTFPDALALGIQAFDEVVDVVVVGEVNLEQLHERLSTAAPRGLEINSVRKLDAQERKLKLAASEYALALPPHRSTPGLAAAIEQLHQTDTLVIQRKEKQVTINLRETLSALCLSEAHLKMHLRTTSQSQLQPRDILAALGLHELLREGAILSRTKVELTQ